MRVTEKTNTIHYLPQEIRETRLTEVTYLPIAILKILAPL